MTIVADPKATVPVQRFVLALNTLLAETPITAPERAGEKRAAKRMKAEAKAMKKWWASAAKARKGQPVSRQVRRRMERDQEKSLISAAKRQAMASKAPGGAAAV